MEFSIDYKADSREYAALCQSQGRSVSGYDFTHITGLGQYGATPLAFSDEEEAAAWIGRNLDTEELETRRWECRPAEISELEELGFTPFSYSFTTKEFAGPEEPEEEEFEYCGSFAAALGRLTGCKLTSMRPSELYEELCRKLPETDTPDGVEFLAITMKPNRGW